MQPDHKVTTWASKQVHLDKDYMLRLTGEEEAEYYLVCLSPQSRWLLVSLVDFISQFYNRWDLWASDREIDQLVAETTEGLYCPMACSDDIQAINTTLATINTTLGEIRDALGGVTADLDLRLVEIKTEVADIDVALADLGLPDLIDKLEPMLNGIGVILGAPPISANGA